MKFTAVILAAGLTGAMAQSSSSTGVLGRVSSILHQSSSDSSATTMTQTSTQTATMTSTRSGASSRTSSGAAAGPTAAAAYNLVPLGIAVAAMAI